MILNYYIPSNIVTLIYTFCCNDDKLYMKYFFEKHKLYFGPIKDAYIAKKICMNNYYNIITRRYAVFRNNMNAMIYRPIVKEIYKEFKNNYKENKRLKIYELIKFIKNRKKINHIFNILLNICDKKYEKYIRKYRIYYMDYNLMLKTIKIKRKSILSNSKGGIKTFKKIYNSYKPIPVDIDAKIISIDYRFLKHLKSFRRYHYGKRYNHRSNVQYF